MIRDRLVGSWRLVRYDALRGDGDVYFPLGEDATGVLHYGAAGEVSVHIERPCRAPFAGGDLASASDAEFAAAARGYFAYYGRYEVDEAKSTVTHRLEMCLVPNWSGAAQTRHARFEGDTLTLTGYGVPIAGAARTIRVVWRRDPAR